MRHLPALLRRRSDLAGPLLVLLALLASLGPVHAQDDDEQPSEEGYFEAIDVEIVNVDVWVSDRQGRPVDGLGKEDFVVHRDGIEVPVANFYAVANGRPVERPAAAPAASAETGRQPRLELEPIERTTSEVAPEHRLWLVLFVDNYNIDPIERNRVLPAVRRFLGETLRGGDQAMIVTYDRSLEVRQPFTEDVNVLYGVLDELVGESGLATIRNRERTEMLQLIDRSKSPVEAMSAARNYAESQMNAVSYTADALGRLVNTLGGLPGRKALVHVSSGIPMLAGEELFQVVAVKWNSSEAYAEIPRHDTTREFERVTRLANAHRVVFHTLDAGGLRGLEFGGAEHAGFISPKIRTTLDSVVSENLQSPLRLLAQETGGRAILNRNEIFPALAETASDFRSFYSLGISSSTADSGSYHELEVELKNPSKDLIVRHRAGYRSKSPQTRMRESLRSALLYAHQSNPLGVAVQWGRPTPHDDDQYLLPIRLEIPMRDLVLLPLGEKHELRLELYVGAAGDQGEISEVDRLPLGLRLEEQYVEAARAESFVYEHKALLSRGRKKVGVLVFDVFGRQSSVVTRYFQVGEAVDVERN